LFPHEACRAQVAVHDFLWLAVVLGVPFDVLTVLVKRQEWDLPSRKSPVITKKFSFVDSV